MEEELKVVLAFAVAATISIALGWAISDSRGRNPVEGIALGCLLGPLGWLIAILLPERIPSGRWSGPRADPRADRHPGESLAEGRYFSGPSEQAVADQARAAALSRAASGALVTEASWMDAEHGILAVAFGRPALTYRRRWPTLPDVAPELFEAASLHPSSVRSMAVDAPPGQAADDRPTRSCPHCAERIHATARVCRHCGGPVEPLLV